MEPDRNQPQKIKRFITLDAAGNPVEVTFDQPVTKTDSGLYVAGDWKQEQS